MIQPGSGYTLVNSSGGMAINIDQPWMNYDEQALDYQGFECSVYSETVDGVTKWYLKTRQGVCNYSWTQFPFNGVDMNGIYTTGASRDSVERQKQVIVKDWAIYKTGSRTAGTDTASQWFGQDGKIELKNAEDGGSDEWLVCISKLDWWDKDGWNDGRRIIEAEVPYVSVFAADNTDMQSRILTQWDNSLWENITSFIVEETTPGSGIYDIRFVQDYVPRRIGYCVKKIAKIAWDAGTSSFQVTQYITGQIELPIMYHSSNVINKDSGATEKYYYDLGVANQFSTTIDSENYDWFESMWAPATGYSFNSSDWSQLLVDE